MQFKRPVTIFGLLTAAVLVSGCGNGNTEKLKVGAWKEKSQAVVFQTNQKEQEHCDSMFLLNQAQLAPFSFYGECASLPTAVATGLNNNISVSEGILSGSLSVEPAANESNVTHYVLYWGANTTTKLANQAAIATMPKESANHVFKENTEIPAGARHLLVYAKNAIGEAYTPYPLALFPITERTEGVYFIDGDKDSGEVGGTLYIAPAADQTAITQYALYWAASSFTKLAGEPVIAVLEKGNLGDMYHYFDENTPIPSGATGLVIFAKNAEGESTYACPIQFSVLDGLNVDIDRAPGTPAQMCANWSF